MPPGTSKSPQPCPGPAPRRLALIIEDDPNVRLTLELVLIAEGYETLCTDGSREGLALFQSHHHRLALVAIDYSLPDMDGIEAVAAMRRTAIVPTVIMTGLDPQSLPAAPLGAAGEFLVMLGKPFSIEVFLQAVARI